MSVLERVGVQEPRVSSWPAFESSLGDEAVELAASCGLVLDPWQRVVLRAALGRGADGKWAAFEVGLCVPRQNGKGGVLEARELASLFLVGDKLVIHSAHEFPTSMEAFMRMEGLLEEGGLTAELKRGTRGSTGVSKAHGSEGFEFTGGRRLRYRTRTKGGGRGFSCDLLILDEAMFLSQYAHGALLPTLSAMPNPQVWYTGSAVDQLVHDHGLVFAKVRQRGVAEADPSLAYFEWSADFEEPGQLEETDAEDDALWAVANPGLGIRIDPAYVANEQRSMDARTFAVERLGVGDWPDPDLLESVIDLSLWDGLRDDTSKIASAAAVTYDVSPLRTSATVAVTGRREDGKLHTEIVRHDRGTGWVVDEVEKAVADRSATQVVCDGGGPAGALIPELEKRRLKVESLAAQEYARACGVFFDTVDQRGLRWVGESPVRSAIKGAATRPLGDAWAWSRKNSGVDITPLVATTVGVWAASSARSAGPSILDWSQV